MTLLPKTFALLGFAFTALATPALADTYHHIDQLALSIDRQAKELVRESCHYRHTPEYAHLVTDAREMSQLAEHLHEVAHHHGSLAHLIHDVEELDAKFHHLESLFDRIERRAAHGHGHVHGNTAHVRELLDVMADNIHHLQEDLDSLRRPIHTRRPVVSSPRTPFATPYGNTYGGYPSRGYGGYGYGGYGYGGRHHGPNAYQPVPRGRGITIGGGSSRFTIRF